MNFIYNESGCENDENQAIDHQLYHDCPYIEWCHEDTFRIFFLPDQYSRK